MVSWQTVLQECDEEMEECTPTFNKDFNQKQSNVTNKPKTAFMFPETFVSPAGCDLDALSANLRLANQQAFLCSTTNQANNNNSVLNSQ